MNATLTTRLPRTARRPLALSRIGQLFIAVLMIAVFEGALRKWVSNSLSLPLVALRDLLAVLVIFLALRGGYLRQNMRITAPMFAWSLLVFGWGLFQLVGGQSSPLIFIIGLRFWLLYTWFAIAAAAAMNEADYRAAFLTVAWMMLLMAPLVVVQHYLPPGARINVQLEGDEKGIFVSVGGVVRTTGTFSFTFGFATFLSLAAPLVFGLLSARKHKKWQFVFSISVFVAFFVGTVMSGSRAAVIFSGGIFMAYLVGRLLFSKMRQKPAAAIAIVASLVVLAVFAYFFQDAISVTQERFEEASEGEDFWERMLAVFRGERFVYSTLDWLGLGVGIGSNLANTLRNVGGFAVAESESGRILLEGGLLGIALMALKIVVTAICMTKSIRLSIKTNSPYPILVWLTIIVALFTWSSTAQLTANVLFGVTLAFGLLLFRYPRLELFPARASST